MKVKGDKANTYVRIPMQIRNLLEEAATLNDRSVNSELVRRVKESFRPPVDALAEVDTADLMQELMRRYPPGKIKIQID